MFNVFDLCLLKILAKDSVERSKLPVPEEFSKALYTFDIGQNDLSVGFRKMNFDQIRASMPDIVNQLASAVKVSITHLCLYQCSDRSLFNQLIVNRVKMFIVE